MRRSPSRLLLLLLCCLLPLQSLQAEAGTLSHAPFLAGELASLDEFHPPHAHVPHHHHMDVFQHFVQDVGSAASDDQVDDDRGDHCVCPIGGMLPSATWVVHRVGALQTLPEWMPRPLPAPVLPGPQRPPHAAG